VVDKGKAGVDFGDERKHTGRNDLLFVEKMWMYERDRTKSECCGRLNCDEVMQIFRLGGCDVCSRIVSLVNAQ